MADRQLHIGVDGRELTGQPTGVGRYVESVLREWARDASFHHQVTIFAAQGPAPQVVRDDPRFVWRRARGADGGHVVGADDAARAPSTPRTSTCSSRPATPRRSGSSCPLVVAIYDVSFFAHPEWFGAREGWRRRWLTRSAARRAARVVTISEFSRERDRALARHSAGPRS